MFVQGFGEVLTDVMTVNPALAGLPSASAILDTSNYTFQAVTFGKDAEGFSQHSHVVSTVDYVNGDSASGASSYDSGLLVITNYGSDVTNGASSYVVSATYAQFSSTYNSVPNDPSPLRYEAREGLYAVRKLNNKFCVRILHQCAPRSRTLCKRCHRSSVKCHLEQGRRFRCVFWRPIQVL